MVYYTLADITLVNANNVFLLLFAMSYLLNLIAEMSMWCIAVRNLSRRQYRPREVEYLERRIA